jgi:divalent metal cation (Fe/Co/Zn/Cd) transporter
VVLEDSTALLGVAIAALGLTLHRVTGNAQWDAAASIAIGVLLAVIAFEIGRDSESLLIGESADPQETAALRATFARHADELTLVDLATARIGPDELIVVAWIEFADNLAAPEIERLADLIERELMAAVPAVVQVFLDPTAARPGT